MKEEVNIISAVIEWNYRVELCKLNKMFVSVFNLDITDFMTSLIIKEACFWEEKISIT